MAFDPYDIYHNGKTYDRQGNEVINRAVVTGTRGNGNVLTVAPAGNVMFGDVQWYVYRAATKTATPIVGANSFTVTQTGLNAGDFYYPLIHDLSIANFS